MRQVICNACGKIESEPAPLDPSMRRRSKFTYCLDGTTRCEECYAKPGDVKFVSG